MDPGTTNKTHPQPSLPDLPENCQWSTYYTFHLARNLLCCCFIELYYQVSRAAGCLLCCAITIDSPWTRLARFLPSALVMNYGSSMLQSFIHGYMHDMLNLHAKICRSPTQSRQEYYLTDSTSLTLCMDSRILLSCQSKDSEKKVSGKIDVNEDQIYLKGVWTSCTS